MATDIVHLNGAFMPLAEARVPVPDELLLGLEAYGRRGRVSGSGRQRGGDWMGE